MPDRSNMPKTGRCIVCETVGAVAGTNANGRPLCQGCIDYMNGEHLKRTVPNKRGYGMKKGEAA